VGQRSEAGWFSAWFLIWLYGIPAVNMALPILNKMTQLYVRFMTVTRISFILSTAEAALGVIHAISVLMIFIGTWGGPF
jgi:hypothetical protein